MKLRPQHMKESYNGCPISVDASSLGMISLARKTIHAQ